MAGSFTLAEFDAFRAEAEERLREARAVIVSRERWTERRVEFVDALMVVARDPSAILRLPARPLRDALRALCGKVAVGRDKVLRFPPESTVEILRGLAGFNADGERGATSRLLNLSRLFACDFGPLIHAAAALRVG